MSFSIFNKIHMYGYPWVNTIIHTIFTQKLTTLVQRFIIKFKNIQFFNPLCQDNKLLVILQK